MSADIEVLLAFVGIAPFAADTSAVVDIFPAAGICPPFGFYQAWLAGTSLAVLHIVVVGQHIFLLSAPFGLVSGLVSLSAV